MNPQLLAILLTLTVFPGMGHFYLGYRLRAYFWGILFFLSAFGGLVRYLSLIFALANVSELRQTHGIPWRLALHAWQSDRLVLASLLILTLVLGCLTLLDLLWIIRKHPSADYLKKNGKTSASPFS